MLRFRPARYPRFGRLASEVIPAANPKPGSEYYLTPKSVLLPPSGRQSARVFVQTGARIREVELRLRYEHETTYSNR